MERFPDREAFSVYGRKRTQASVLVVAPLALDDITTPEGSVTETLGGSAAYAALAARHFAPTAIAAVVGEDFPARYLALLGGIDLSRVRRLPGRSFRWVGEHHADGTTVTHRNEPGVGAGVLPQVADADGACVYLGADDPTLQGRVRTAIGSARLVAVDTMPCFVETAAASLRAVLTGAHVAFATLREGAALTGERDADAIARALLALDVKIVVLKDGPAGASVYHAGRSFFVPAPAVAAVDPTGAGDAFAGAFLASLAAVGRADEESLRVAGLRGAAAASLTVEGFGTLGLARASRAEIDTRAREIGQLARSA